MEYKKIKVLVDNVVHFYNSFVSKRKESNSEGLTNEQFIKKETGNLEFIKEKAREILSNILGNDDIDLSNIIDDVTNFSSKFKTFLESDEDEELEELVSKLIGKNILKNEKIEEELGSENFTKLVSFILIMGLKVTKSIYQYAKNYIDKVSLLSTIKTTVQDYVGTVVKFLNEEVKIQEYSTEILEFAFGNKPRAIISSLIKFANRLFNKGKDLTRDFNEVKEEIDKEFSEGRRNKTSSEVAKQKRHEKENNA